jgi:cation diffusion facilitator family transporter
MTATAKRKSSQRSQLLSRSTHQLRLVELISSASLHVLGDLLSSVGVFISSIVIWYNPEYTIIDPICTFIFSAIVMLTTVRIMSQSMNILMEATPWNVDVDQIIHDLMELEGIQCARMESYCWEGIYLHCMVSLTFK